VIVNDDSRVINKLETSLTDDAKVIIYNCQMFIVQATGVYPRVESLMGAPFGYATTPLGLKHIFYYDHNSKDWEADRFVDVFERTPTNPLAHFAIN